MKRLLIIFTALLFIANTATADTFSLSNTYKRAYCSTGATNSQMWAQVDSAIYSTPSHYRAAAYFSIDSLYAEYISPEDITAVRITATLSSYSSKKPRIYLKKLIDTSEYSYNNINGTTLLSQSLASNINVSDAGTLALLVDDINAGKSQTGWGITASHTSGDSYTRQYGVYSSPTMTVTYTNTKKLYLENNETSIGEDWDATDADNLFNVYKYGGSIIVDEKAWYKQENYLAQGYWGMARGTTAEGFIDAYGFKHMYLGYYEPTGESIGLTDCDKSLAWQRIAAAGYTDAEGGIAGDTAWTLEDVDALNELYENQSGSVAINNIIWYYTDNDYSDSQIWGERELGEFWIDANGFGHIYLGSGLVTYNESAIPEPCTVILMTIALAGLIRRKSSK